MRYPRYRPRQAFGCGSTAYERAATDSRFAEASAPPLAAAGEALGFAAGGAALHVDDLAVPQCQHLVALLAATVGELRLDLDPAAASLFDLEGQDLTGLVRAVSDGRLFPPQMAVRDAAPLCVLCEQCRERFRVALAKRFGCGAKLVDHRPSMPPA